MPVLFCPARTNETLQNLTLELATMGDLKLVERLQQYTLAPGASKVIRANIKVGVEGACRGWRAR
jgi:vesicle coat complex subunit